LQSSLRPIVIIPARMASTRLPGKPLADIAGLPMIVQVAHRAEEADIGPVVVAAGDEAIADAARSAGLKAVMTSADHASGSDRVHEALTHVDGAGEYDVIVNLQGDLPAIDPAALGAVIDPLAQSGDVDIATLAAEIRDAAERDDPNAVKAVVSLEPGARTGRALWFSRLATPWGDGPMYHHIGIYAFRRKALERFVALPPAPIERRERLEQLRALEAGMRIDAALVDTVPLGVDTPADLAVMRALFASR
jgi:3-deoxy-manno-octulosonate cytidylyltransferase (CMP-KDO synthetase)